MEPKNGSIKSVKDLRVYNESFRLAMEIFNLTKKFPKEELYSLTDQIRRSSRSVPINVREGYAKKKYENVFTRHLVDALGSSEETRGWLEFCLECKYITKDEFQNLDNSYANLGGMLANLEKVWHPLSKEK
jgi:four helix bundle protein